MGGTAYYRTNAEVEVLGSGTQTRKDSRRMLHAAELTQGLGCKDIERTRSQPGQRIEGPRDSWLIMSE